MEETDLLQGTGLPPVLPSLAKPKPQATGMPSLGPATPFTGLPPVTTLNPSPEERAVGVARNQLQHDQQTPSFTAGLWNKTKGSDSFLGKLGHIGAGILRGVDIGGEILAPNLARNIPGTGLNRSQNIARDQASLASAEANAHTAAETQNQEAQTHKALYGDPLEAQKEQARSDLEKTKEQERETAASEREANAQRRQEAMFRESEDRQSAGFKEGEARQQRQFAEEEKLVRMREANKGGEGPWAIDKTGMPFRVREGQRLPDGAQLVTGALNTESKKIQGANAASEAVGYAKTYLDSKNYTGPGDEALMERFFEVAKPTSGFRMTQQQMDMLMKARSWMDSAEAQAQHAKVGTYFSDDQRKQISETMQALQQARGGATGYGSDNPPQEAGGKSVETLQKEGWTWKQGSHGWGWYK